MRGDGFGQLIRQSPVQCHRLQSGKLSLGLSSEMIAFLLQLLTKPAVVLGIVGCGWSSDSGALLDPFDFGSVFCTGFIKQDLRNIHQLAPPPPLLWGELDLVLPLRWGVRGASA